MSMVYSQDKQHAFYGMAYDARGPPIFRLTNNIARRPETLFIRSDIWSWANDDNHIYNLDGNVQYIVEESEGFFHDRRILQDAQRQPLYESCSNGFTSSQYVKDLRLGSKVLNIVSKYNYERHCAMEVRRGESKEGKAIITTQGKGKPPKFFDIKDEASGRLIAKVTRRKASEQSWFHRRPTYYRVEIAAGVDMTLMVLIVLGVDEEFSSKPSSSSGSTKNANKLGEALGQDGDGDGDGDGDVDVEG